MVDLLAEADEVFVPVNLPGAHREASDRILFGGGKDRPLEDAIQKRLDVGRTGGRRCGRNSAIPIMQAGARRISQPPMPAGE